MILFHGSNSEIGSIDLERCRPYKDFGRGSYLTQIEVQAVQMARRTSTIFEKLTLEESGLYLESSAYVYELYLSKIK